MARPKGSKNKTRATTADVVPPESQEEPAPRQADALLDSPEPGVGKVRIEEIEQAALAYKRVRDQRQVLTKKEVELKKALVIVMKAHEIASYQFDDQEVEYLSGKENVKVKTIENAIELEAD